MRPLVLSIVAMAVLTTTAVAQPSPSPGPEATARNLWSVSAGYEVFALRDISRSGRPPDASPISWRGSGPSVSGRYDIIRRRSAHVIEAMAARARDFSYAGPSRSTSALASDLASRVAATYEYRCYLWRDLVFDGLDIGLGAQGLATRVGFDRHITSTLATTTRITGGGAAGVVSIVLRRFDRLRAEATWANGAVVSSRTWRHSVQAADETHRGGNWLTYSMVRADWRLTRTTQLVAAWRGAYDGYESSHYSYAARRHTLELGVSYAR